MWDRQGELTGRPFGLLGVSRLELVSEPAKVSMRHAKTFLGRTRLNFSYSSRFGIMCDLWRGLCPGCALAHLSGDWEGLSERLVG